MSETTNLKLFKHDNPSTNENQFDVNKALNQNWDKLDEFSGEVNDKVIEIEDNIEGQELDIGELQQKTEQIEENVLDIQQGQETQNTEIANLQTEVQELNEDIKANAIIEETEKTKSLYIDDANASRGILNVLGNAEQETRNGYNLINILNSSLLAQDKGVKIDISKDGYITANGTPTADYVVFIKKSIDDLLENGMTYSVWQEKHSQTTDGEIYSQVLATPKEGSSGSQQYINSSTKKATFVVDKNKYTYNWTLQIGLRSVAGAFNNYKNRYMLYKGTDNKNFELYGASPSFDYPSPIKCVGSNKNLYKPVATSGTKNRISYSIDEKGIVTLNGTASAQTDIAIINSTLNNQISNVAGKKITFKAFNSDLSLYGYLTGAKYVKDTAILTDTETEILSSFIRIPANTECNNLVVYPKIEEGEKTSYSPYNQGSTEIKHTNKNIVDLLAQTLKINGWHMSESYNENDAKMLKFPYNKNAIWDAFYFSLDERYVGKTISFSFDIKVKNLKYLNPERFCLQNSNEYSKSVIKNMYSSSLKEDTYTRITVEGYNLKNSTIAFFAGVKYNSEEPDTDSMYVYIKNFQIELGEQATEYTEHQEESYSLDIQQDMVSSEDDYFDLERKKEVHGWKKVIFDGVENKFTWSFTLGENRIFRANGNYWDSSSSIETTDVKCTHFKTSNSWAEGTIYGKYTTSGVAIQVILKNSVASSKEILNDILKQKYDTGEPMIVYYKDEAPTELDLTDTQIEQLEKLNKLRFYEGVNNIMTLEDIALIQAQYSINIQTKINNLISTQLNQIGGI